MPASAGPGARVWTRPPPPLLVVLDHAGELGLHVRLEALKLMGLFAGDFLEGLLPLEKLAFPVEDHPVSLAVAGLPGRELGHPALVRLREIGLAHDVLGLDLGKTPPKVLDQVSLLFLKGGQLRGVVRLEVALLLREGLLDLLPALKERFMELGVLARPIVVALLLALEKLVAKSRRLGLLVEKPSAQVLRTRALLREALLGLRGLLGHEAQIRLELADAGEVARVELGADRGFLLV